MFPDFRSLGAFFMARIYVSLKASECDALFALAERERRDVRDQAALLIRYALLDEGLLSPESPPLFASHPPRAAEVERDRLAR
jgi:hypothetical protein